MRLPFNELPHHLEPGLRNWLIHGVKPGGFLTAVITNDLEQAVVRMDIFSAATLKQLVLWLVNHAPEGSYGPKALTAWPEYLRALERQADQAEKEHSYE